MLRPAHVVKHLHKEFIHCNSNMFKFNGHQWNSMKHNEIRIPHTKNQCTCVHMPMKSNETQWNSMELNRIEWKSKEFIGFQRNSMELNGIPWNSMELNFENP